MEHPSERSAVLSCLASLRYATDDTSADGAPAFTHGEAHPCFERDCVAELELHFCAIAPTEHAILEGRLARQRRVLGALGVLVLDVTTLLLTARDALRLRVRVDIRTRLLACRRRTGFRLRGEKAASRRHRGHSENQCETQHRSGSEPNTFKPCKRIPTHAASRVA